MTRSRQTRSRLEAGRRSPALPPIAAACSVLILISSLAYAQTAATTETQTVTVKGIEDAINVKKNSDSIVEAISAENISWRSGVCARTLRCQRGRHQVQAVGQDIWELLAARRGHQH